MNVRLLDIAVATLMSALGAKADIGFSLLPNTEKYSIYAAMEYFPQILNAAGMLVILAPIVFIERITKSRRLIWLPVLMLLFLALMLLNRLAFSKLEFEWIYLVSGIGFGAVLCISYFVLIIHFGQKILRK
jgi:energy-coupling factor transporter transmembrane protein EcfT